MGLGSSEAPASRGRSALFVLDPALAALCRPARSLGSEAEEERRRALRQGGGAGFRMAFRGDQSLARTAESLGLPRCEIGWAFVDGEAAGPESTIPDNARVELGGADGTPPRGAAPGWETGADEGGAPRFVLDVHLGRLARDLRLLGMDVLWSNDLADADIERLAAAEGRAILTRDRGILFRRSVRRGMLVRSRDPYEQLVDAARRFSLGRWLRPLSLCSSCGAGIAPAGKAEVADLLPPAVAARYGDFFRCPACGKVYWRGDHFRNIGPFLLRLLSDLGGPSECGALGEFIYGPRAGPGPLPKPPGPAIM